MTPAASRPARRGLSVVMLACHEPEDREALDSVIDVLFARHPRLQAPKTVFVRSAAPPPAEGDEESDASDDPDAPRKAEALVTNARILLGAERNEWFEYDDGAATSFAAITEAASRCDQGVALIPVVGPTRCGMARLVAEKTKAPQPVILCVQANDKAHTHGRAFAECVVDDTPYGEVALPLFDAAISYDSIADAVAKIADHIARDARLKAAATDRPPPHTRAARENH